MPSVLDYSVYQNVAGGLDFLEKFKNFAASAGWDVDSYGPEAGDQLVLHSDGWGEQGLLYALSVTHSTRIGGSNEDILNVYGCFPSYRPDNPASHPWAYSVNLDTWNQVSIPSISFQSLYLFGNSKFLSAVLHVLPTFVITIAIGTIDLFDGWKAEVDENAFHWPVHRFDLTQSYSLWSNAISYPAYWKNPFLSRSSTGGLNSDSYYMLYYGDIGHTSADVVANWILDSNNNYKDRYNSSGAGSWNIPAFLLAYNNYTEKRMAFSPVYFRRNTVTNVWYPLGTLPLALMNSRDLSVGEHVKYGSDEYIVLPSVYYEYDIWQAYRIA